MKKFLSFLALLILVAAPAVGIIHSIKLPEKPRKPDKTPEQIADFCGIPLQQVKEVERNMLSLA